MLPLFFSVTTRSLKSLPCFCKPRWTNSQKKLFLHVIVGERLNGAVIRVGNDPGRNNPSCEQTLNFDPDGGHSISEVTCNLAGRFLSISSPGTDQLYLCEVRATAGNCQQGECIMY